MSIRTPLMTLATTVALIAGSTAVYADSPREWGYWDAATAAGPGDAGNDGFSDMTLSQDINTAKNNNAGSRLNSDQNTTRFNRDVDAPDTKALGTDYVAYNICYYNCDNRKRARNHLKPKRAVKTAGKTYARVTPNADASSAQLQLVGDYNGKSFQYFDNDAKIFTRDKGDYSQSDISSKRPALYFSSGIKETYAGQDISAYFSGDMGIGKSYGSLLLGKPISAADIAKQFRIGQSYNFAGRSHYGSNVNIKVNFQKANWKGNWSKVKKMHNGFKASGSITGSTLISNKVKGFGKKNAVGFVKKGSVDATLVGVINGTDASKAAIIGKTVLTVKKRRGTKKVADIFAAKAVVKTPKVLKPAIVR